MFMRHELCYCLFFFNDTATSEIYTLSLHDALPISRRGELARRAPDRAGVELAELPDLLRVWSLSVAARHLQHGGEALEPWMAEEDGEPVAELAFADVRVAIPVRAKIGRAHV